MLVLLVESFKTNKQIIVDGFFAGYSNSRPTSHTVGADDTPFFTPTSAMADELGCSHPHYGDGFAPHKGQAAVVKT